MNNSKCPMICPKCSKEWHDDGGGNYTCYTCGYSVQEAKTELNPSEMKYTPKEVKCPKCNGEWRDEGDGNYQCYNCGWSVQRPSEQVYAPKGIRGGMKVTILPDGKAKIETISEEDLDRLGIKASPPGPGSGQVPDPETVKRMIEAAVKEGIGKALDKDFKAAPDYQSAKDMLGHISVQDIDEKDCDPRIREYLRQGKEFMASFKPEIIEKFLKEKLYGDKYAMAHAQRHGITVTPFIIELVSYINDSERTAHNFNHFFGLSKIEKAHVVSILATMSFAYIAQAAGHEDWSKDVFRRPKEDDKK